MTHCPNCATVDRNDAEAVCRAGCSMIGASGVMPANFDWKNHAEICEDVDVWLAAHPSEAQPVSDKGLCRHPGHRSSNGARIEHERNEYCVGWNPVAEDERLHCLHCGLLIYSDAGMWRHHASNFTAREGLDGVALIAAERLRQVSVEGWTPEHDDAHRQGEISMAARAYVSIASEEIRTPGTIAERWMGRPYGGFPWWDFWKPSHDPIRNLVKAGALIAAEIDRLNRLQALQAMDAETKVKA